MRRSLISRESIVLCFADSLPKDYKGSGVLTLYLRTEIDCIGVQRLLKSTNKFMRRIFSFKLLWHFHLAHQMSSHQIIKPSIILLYWSVDTDSHNGYWWIMTIPIVLGSKIPVFCKHFWPVNQCVGHCSNAAGRVQIAWESSHWVGDLRWSHTMPWALGSNLVGRGPYLCTGNQFTKNPGQALLYKL